VAHAKPPVARSWAMPNEAFAGHSYGSSFPISPGFRMAQLIVEHEGIKSWLEVEQVRLDGQPVGRERSFRRVRPDLFENETVLPRAFLVGRVRRVAPEQLLEQLKYLDPAEEALVSDPLPANWPSRVSLVRPLPPVRVTEYAPHRVRLETTVDQPALLILSDTYAPGWQAWDNGRPVGILRTDHALRGIPLGPGSHVVDLRYRQPEFWLGLAISGATALGLVVGAVLGCRRARRGRVSPSQATPR